LGVVLDEGGGFGVGEDEEWEVGEVGEL